MDKSFHAALEMMEMEICLYLWLEGKKEQRTGRKTKQYVSLTLISGIEQSLTTESDYHDGQTPGPDRLLHSPQPTHANWPCEDPADQQPMRTSLAAASNAVC